MSLIKISELFTSWRHTVDVRYKWNVLREYLPPPGSRPVSTFRVSSTSHVTLSGTYEHTVLRIYLENRDSDDLICEKKLYNSAIEHEEATGSGKIHKRITQSSGDDGRCSRKRAVENNVSINLMIEDYEDWIIEQHQEKTEKYLSLHISCLEYFESVNETGMYKILTITSQDLNMLRVVNN